MIPSYHAVLDRVEGVLNPSFGLLGVVDFFTSEGSGTARERAIGSARRKCSWLSKWFWEIWFSFDHVHLSESRRNYLEYKFGVSLLSVLLSSQCKEGVTDTSSLSSLLCQTIKSYNGRNGFILPFLIQIPFYVNISVPRSRDITRLVRALNTQTVRLFLLFRSASAVQRKALTHSCALLLFDFRVPPLVKPRRSLCLLFNGLSPPRLRTIIFRA
jgi:betaine lipid synthase